jgi:hypothetical protein
MNDDDGYGFYCDLEVSPQNPMFSKKIKTTNATCFDHYLRPFNDHEYYYDDTTIINIKKYDDSTDNIDFNDLGKKYMNSIYFSMSCIATMCIGIAFIFKKV